MTVQDLINLYNGKPCKVLPATIQGLQSPQCFDLAVAWTDLLGVPHFPNNPSPFPYGSAYEIYVSFGEFQAQYFDRIPNTPEGVPQAGDLVIWSSSYNGGAGHVAVATGSGDTNHFQAFEQNDPNPYCQLKDYNYGSVLGWLRFKATPITDDCPAKLTQVTEERDRLNKVIEGKDETISHLGDTINQKNGEIASLTTSKQVLADSLIECQNRLASVLEQAKKVTELTELSQAQEVKIQKLNDEITNLKKTIGAYKGRWELMKWSLKKLVVEKLLPLLA